jgi:hypothetical protein
MLKETTILPELLPFNILSASRCVRSANVEELLMMTTPCLLSDY